MGKRITLTWREIDHIEKALKVLQNQTNLDYAVIDAGKQVYQDIIDKFEYVPHKPAPNKLKEEGRK